MPRVSVIVPARNEEGNIGPCVASVLAQSVDLEVLVADDGSTDRTAAIVAEAAQGEPRLRLIAVPKLPPGWVGKNHALAVAARQAAGDWLLFTDADTRHLPGGLQQSLQRAEPFALYSLSPEQEVVTWWEKAVIPRVYRELERLYSFEEINRPDSPAAAANGQYILIRRAVYEELGGHAALAGEILEDVALARKVKTAGNAMHFTSGAGVVRTRMYTSFAAMREGWTKNLYLLLGRSQGNLLATVGWLVLLDLAPVVVALLWPPLWLLVLGRHIWYAVKLRRSGVRAALAVYLIPGSVLVAALLIRSLNAYRKGHTVAWKGRTYKSWSI